MTVRVNRRCPKKCSVTVAFGSELIGDGNCYTQANVTSEPLYPGASATLSVEAGSVIRISSHEYCYLVSLCGNLGKYLA